MPWHGVLKFLCDGPALVDGFDEGELGLDDEPQCAVGDRRSPLNLTRDEDFLEAGAGGGLPVYQPASQPA